MGRAGTGTHLGVYGGSGLALGPSVLLQLFDIRCVLRGAPVASVLGLPPGRWPSLQLAFSLHSSEGGCGRRALIASKFL